jgi:hypothetical protein
VSEFSYNLHSKSSYKLHSPVLTQASHKLHSPVLTQASHKLHSPVRTQASHKLHSPVLTQASHKLHSPVRTLSTSPRHHTTNNPQAAHYLYSPGVTQPTFPSPHIYHVQTSRPQDSPRAGTIISTQPQSAVVGSPSDDVTQESLGLLGLFLFSRVIRIIRVIVVW